MRRLPALGQGVAAARECFPALGHGLPALGQGLAILRRLPGMRICPAAVRQGLAELGFLPPVCRGSPGPKQIARLIGRARLGRRAVQARHRIPVERPGIMPLARLPAGELLLTAGQRLRVLARLIHADVS